MLPPIYDALAAAPAVAVVVGARIYPHGEAPQDGARPYITWQLVEAAPENSLSEDPDIDRCAVQINCWHPVGVGVVHLASAVRAAVQAHGYVTGTVVNSRDAETRLYWIALQMDWWLQR